MILWHSHRNNFLALAVVTLLLYSGTLHAPFVLDDISFIVRNTQTTDFQLLPGRRILGEFTFFLNHKLHGFYLPGFHAINLLFHLANVLLVYLLTLTILKTPVFLAEMKPSYIFSLPLAAALIFSVHPLQTSTVNYLSQRITILSAFFYLLTLICYLRYRQSEYFYLLILSLVSSVMALFSKENALTIPVSILLCEWLFFDGGKRRFLAVAVYVLPMIIAVATMLRLGSLTVSSLLAVSAESGAPSRLDYALSQLPVVVRYLQLAFIPIGQSMDHNVTLRSSFFDQYVILSACVLISILVTVCVLVRKSLRTGRSRTYLISFGIIWFFVLIPVESGLIPLRDLMFEHRLYLPLAALSITATGGLFFWRSENKSDVPSGILVAVICMALAFGTLARNRIWQSEISLWEDAVVKGERKGRTHGLLAHAYQRAGQDDKAIMEYKKVVEFSPDDFIARNNLAAVYLKKKMYPEAEEALQAAARLSPKSPAVFFNLGLLYGAQGRLEDAKASLNEALRLKPDYKEAQENIDSLSKASVRR